MKCLNNLDSYRDYGKIKNYLYVIVGNLIRNYYKKPKEVCIEDGGNREETVPDQWQYQILARILEKKRVIYVTEPKWESMIREMKMDFAPTLEEALRQARKLTGDGEITVIPNGISVYAE